MRKILVAIISVLLLSANNALALELKPKASLDSTHILIGDQVNLHLEIVFSNNNKIGFPEPGDYLGAFVEIIERSEIDTIQIDEATTRLAQDYIVTSFDTGQHVIPRFYFQFENDLIADSVSTNQLVLNVYTIPKIDSLITAYKGPIDIKAPIEAPITFKEVAPWLLGTILGLGLLFLIFYAIKKRKNKQPIFRAPPKPKEPAHLIALRKLDQVKEEKVWQEGAIKQYYTDLTETIREYIENRFEIQALEQTSDEILAAFKAEKSLINQKTFDNLEKFLKNADLVKFAKYSPLPDENNIALVDAYFFVNETKIMVNKAQQEESNDEESEEVDFK